jgi:subtilisin family serine protease
MISPAPTTAPRGGLATAPRNWQLLDETLDHVPGLGVDRLQQEILHGAKPKATVIVAVIDGGVDTAHVDLRANLWLRPADAPPDGHPGERFGWNFIGGPDGRDVDRDTYELTRIVARCRRSDPTLPAPLAARCPQLSADLDTRRTRLETNLRVVGDTLGRVWATLRRLTGTDSLTVDRVKALAPADSVIARYRKIYLTVTPLGITDAALGEALASARRGLDASLNPDFDPRPLVGDHYGDVTESRYGNPDVMGPDASHGTHVSGIIGAVQGNGVGIDGIAPAVRVMMIRAVPNGDERDKDIANAIRFAVDHGARIINMSFGKGYSPEKPAVDAAVRYADAHNVLMVHAAGNDGANLDSVPGFPTPIYADSGSAQNWIEVGASSWIGGDSLVAPFSNYGRTRVDVFAPGVDITSTVPGNRYEAESGTSMATPVVAGLAALILDYHPELSAAQLREVILVSATRYTNQLVIRPGSKGVRVPFGSLSRTGGIVSAYEAFKLLQPH